MTPSSEDYTRSPAFLLVSPGQTCTCTCSKRILALALNHFDGHHQVGDRLQNNANLFETFYFTMLSPIVWSIVESCFCCFDPLTVDASQSRSLAVSSLACFLTV